jgi:hypothetical protein
MDDRSDRFSANNDSWLGFFYGGMVGKKTC